MGELNKLLGNFVNITFESNTSEEGGTSVLGWISSSLKDLQNTP